MKKSKTKVVAFDFDDTLYTGVDWTFWFEHCKKLVKKIVGKQPKEKEKIIEEAFKNKHFNDQDAINLLAQFGYNQNVWIENRMLNKINSATKYFKNAKAIDNEVLREFAKHYTLFIVTNNYVEGVKMIADALKIDLNYFKDIITAHTKYNAFSKKYRYLDVCQLEKIKPEELFVIGNSSTDIDPAIEIGARGQIVDDCNFKFEDFDF